MKNLKYIAIGCLVFLSLGFVASNSLQGIIESFGKYNEKYIQEKVYLHTDKPYYASGDEIWFKAYVLNAKDLRFSPQSNLLYVELLDQKNQLKKRIRIPLAIGTGWGNFSLPDTLKEGNYRIRAYTNWMRNFDPEFYYDHIFKIGNIRTNQMIVETHYTFAPSGNQEQVAANINYKNIDGNPYANKEVVYKIELEGKEIAKGKSTTDGQGNIQLKFTQPVSSQKTGLITTSVKLSERTFVDKFIPVTHTSDEYSLQFFPEGGDLVTDLRSRVGFKVLKSDGLGADIKGHVEDESGKPVALLNPRYKGMGTFSLIPENGKKYFGVLKFADGTERKYPLPEAKQEGAVLSLIQKESVDSVVIRVMGNKSFVDKNIGKGLNLIAQSGGNLIYSATTKISDQGGFVVKFSLKDFPLGISQITLFNDVMQPMAERLFFVNKDEYLQMNLSGLKNGYKPREKVNIALNVKNPGKRNVVGSFSVAVIDETKVPVVEEEEHTILSEILLNSDLRGNIENPNYYFINQDAAKLEQLDNLMLTQGWRRFKWTDILNQTWPAANYQPEHSLALRGRVKNNKKVVPNASIIAFGAKSSTILQATANENGEFAIDSLVFPDSTKFVIQARSEKGKKFVEIEMDDDIKDQVIPKPQQNDLSVNISSSMLAYLKNSKTQYEELLKYGLTSRTIMLDEVTVIDKRKEMENSSNLNGSGNADKVLTSQDLENAPTLEFALQGKVPGLIFQNGEAYFMRNMSNGTPVQIILDGMYVEPDMLNSINPNDVESVEILKSISYTAIYGSRGGSGVIVINTKRGGGGGFSNTYSPGIISYMPLGLFIAKDFYSPDYGKPEQATTMNDYRSTVYWNPKVIADSTGNARFSYFNTDGKGKYRVVIEGTDLKGHIGRKVIHYNVN